MSNSNEALGVRNLVLVHGGFVDGSGWEDVYHALRSHGYQVTITQHPTLSLADDRSGRRRVCPGINQRPAAGRACPADSAAARRRILVSRPQEVRRVVCRRRAAGQSRVHGRLATALGCRRTRRHTISVASWKAKPSWYLVAKDDRMIPPDAQRFMSKRAASTVVEVPGSHSVYVSQPQAVASLIQKAATGAASLATRTR